MFFWSAILKAFHVLRTDRRTGRERMQSAWKGKKRGYGMNKSIWFQSARRSKTHVKIRPRSLPKPSPASPQTLQNRGSGRPWEAKCTQEAAQARQEAAKSAQQLLKRHPRSVQERPRVAPELPKADEVASKSDPREARILPKPSPTGPKTRIEQDVCRKLCSARPGSDFISFFRVCDKLAICKNLRET